MSAAGANYCAYLSTPCGQDAPRSSTSGSRLRGAICSEAITAQHRPAARRLEGHRVGLATLVAGNLESLTFGASSSLWAAKVRAARIAARLAAFRVSQVAFLVVFLLAFGKWKNISTLGASDLDVWHELFSMSGLRICHSFPRDASESRVRFYWLLTSGVGRSVTLRPFAYGACVSDKWLSLLLRHRWFKGYF